MNRFCICWALVCVVMLAGCSKDGPFAKKAIISKVTVTRYIIDDNGDYQMNFQETQVPTYDAKKRLVKLHVNSWEKENEWLSDYSGYVPHFVESEDEEITITYYDKSHTGLLVIKGVYYVYNSDYTGRTAKEIQNNPMDLTFDSNWYVTSLDESPYTYTGGYFDYAKSVQAGWRGGDLALFGDYTITYSEEPNPFYWGLDLSLYNAYLPRLYYWGLMGKHSAHLPAKIVENYLGTDITEEVSFTKDDAGRITQLRFDTVPASTSYTLIDVEY